MPKAKPGIDWPEIRERYKRGDNTRKIAREYVSETGETVTRQSIEQRRDREGWQIPNTAVIDASRWLPVARRFKELKGRPSFKPKLVAQALEAYTRGANHNVAAGIIGVTRECWRIWRNECPGLSEAIETALASNAMHALSTIHEAAGDDWRAAERVLTANSLTREDYSPKPQAGAGGLVQVNIDLGNTPDSTPVTVESTAKDTTKD